MLFIGVDAGGTRTRAVVATADGEVVGSGTAAGANAWSSGTQAADSITAAVRAALGERDPGLVAAGVVAAAGAVTSVPAQAQEVVAGWHALGLGGSPRIVLDVVAAYAAGTTLPRGLVLAAGTGAVAALVDEGELVRRAGGRGWLVGDEGSAVWLGIEGVRAVLLAMDGRGPETALGQGIQAALGVAPARIANAPTAITDAVYAGAPASLGRLAPLVVECAGQGDAVAAGLVEAAVGHLAGAAVAAAGLEVPAVVVLAGSLLTRATIIGDRVRQRLADHWTDAIFARAASGEAGAVALAIGQHTGRAVSEEVLRRLGGGSADGTPPRPRSDRAGR